MYKIDHCPACHSDNIEKFPAFLYQFIVWRITGNKPASNVPIQGIKCNHCGFTCSESRIDSTEEASLYGGYRGNTYNNMRIECEPGYAQHLATFDDSEYMHVRQFGINMLIDKLVDKDKIKTVLDYGGDKGQHIPAAFASADRYVYEISNVSMLPGIKAFDLNSELLMDFIMCCHVLEHKSEPDAIIKDIKRHMHKDTWLYIEVPEYEMYGPGAAFHEHINSFTDSSMWALLDRMGIELVEAVTTQYKDGYIMCVLAKLK